MSYPFKQSLAASRTNAVNSAPFNPFKTRFIDRVIDGKETVQLLEAPPVTRKAQWKLRSFIHCEKKLRPKLETYSAAALIAIFGHHFDINTHVASDQAETYVNRFKKAFGQVDDLVPLGYFDIKGVNVTGKVRDEKRPPNLAYVLVEAHVPLQKIHQVFSPSDMFTRQYYLALPQSYKTLTPAPTGAGTTPPPAAAVAAATAPLPAAAPTTAKAATAKLRDTGECDFDLSLDGARLRQILFNSRSCTQSERHYHGFIGEIACGRWAISMEKRYLWGSHFYWLCDMKTTYKIMHYTGPIHIMRRWCQELLAYSFSCLHRSHTMMIDVDYLSRMHDPLIQTHVTIANRMSLSDRAARPGAYDYDVLTSLL